jgi:hypothetical protein
MPLFPTQTIAGLPTSHVVHTLDIESGLGAESLATVATFGSTTFTPTTNLTYLYPITVRTPFQLAVISILNGAVVTNNAFEIGIYTESGELIFSSGTLTQSTASASNYQKFSAGPQAIMSGYYFAAMQFQSANGRLLTSGTISPAGRGRGFGMFEVNTGFSNLQSQITFAAKTTTAGIPCISFHGTAAVA